MMQVLSLVALLGLLVSSVPTPSLRPDEEVNGPSLNGVAPQAAGPIAAGFEIGGHQGPSLNGSPFQALGPNVLFSVEVVELPNDILSR